MKFASDGKRGTRTDLTPIFAFAFALTLAAAAAAASGSGGV